MSIQNKLFAVETIIRL